MSRLHAWIVPDGAGIRLEDAGSKNKLIRDGKRLEVIEMIPGVVVQVGRAYLTLEEAPSGEFDLAVKAKTPERDDSEWSVDDTEDLAHVIDGRGPTLGLRLIRTIEKSGVTDAVLSESLEVLDLDSLIAFEVDSEGQCALSRIVGVMLDEERLLALETELVAIPDEATTWLSLSSVHPCIAYHSSSGGQVRCVAGIRSSAEPMEAWQSDLFEYIARRLTGQPPDAAPQPRLRKRGLTLAAGMIVGESQPFRALLQQVEAVADTRLDVLLVGETGTGKELLARTLHDSGPTASGPFIAINCAAIPTELLEAELFGVKGRVATGVDPRVGLFLEADGGSIFLDEIGELAEPLQAKLLRVLQEREVLPIGGSVPRKINVRVIAASNRELLDLTERRRFRRDLYYRMSGLLLRVPALRERKEDIPALSLAFLEKSAREHRKSIVGISRQAMSLLLEHEWPGNVRELQNEVARAVLFSHDRGVLHSEHFESVAEAIEVHRVSGTPADGASEKKVSETERVAIRDGMTLQEMVDQVEREAIEKALRAAKGNKSKAARMLGITRNGLAMKMKRLGL